MAKIPSEAMRESVNLPARPFLYTLDQISGLLVLEMVYLKSNHVFFFEVDAGVPPRNRMLARNIGGQVRDDWRIEEKEFVRWMRHKGILIYEGVDDL